ncbi:MAG: threonine--tRNA ligase [Deltaproteobacteria bacterium CG11_big_fil_rev_8_21_14_0_20_47_16]|nr:MAG: threonine--tRNA ligase [Deltaproteobacteria bacterium CG11_big_fil_rev_8_21_14_0_20_47_16]
MVCRPGFENDPNEIMRHSAAHIMADAVQRLFPSAKITIGPTIDNGFYYDFDYPAGFSTEDLKKIEKKMAEIVAEDHEFKREDISKEDAIKLFTDKGETFKVQIIKDLGDVSLSLYRHGNFVDLCKGPHVKRTKDLKAFKLLKVAGAYWRGDEKNPMLQRIYGTAFAKQSDLDNYLKQLEEAEKRDHRRLGKDLDLFSTMEDYGPGLILWHPKGSRLRKAIEDFWRDQHVKGGYELVYTPHIARLDLWKQSGHWDFYRENMYTPMDVDGLEYELKPMNCPFHIQIMNRKQFSYRELPVRLAELGTVYRYERSGVLHGLMRVRGFTQDDAHIFCRPDQLETEIKTVLEFVKFMLGSFGFKEFQVYLSTRPEKFVGSESDWETATNALKDALESTHTAYEVDAGEGVFYGPKIDIKITDVLGRAWQCSTIQVDFNLPVRYNMEYIGSDGAKHRPIMVHRALLGSIERFVGVLIEHYAGAFPTWLAPVQVQMIPIGESEIPMAESLATEWRLAGLRVDVDGRNEKLGLKIREAQLAKIPYMIIIGAKEREAGRVAVRSRQAGDLGQMTASEFLKKISDEIHVKQ